MRDLCPKMVFAALAFVACSKNEPAPAEQQQPVQPAAPAAPVQVDPAVEARKVFASRCSVCHGNDGTGNGPGAAALNPKPRNYRDAEWQKTVTDEQIKDTILRGGAAVGKSPAMPPNPDLQAKPAVVDALVKHIRSFAN